LKILFLGVFFVPNAILGIYKVHTTHTIGAVSARINKRAVSGVFALLAKFHIVAICAIHALVT